MLPRTYWLPSCWFAVICIGFFRRISGQGGDNVSHVNLNKTFCSIDADCDKDEKCEKVCLWSYPADNFIGCKIMCVKLNEGNFTGRQRNIRKHPPGFFAQPGPRLPSPNQPYQPPQTFPTQRPLGPGPSFPGGPYPGGRPGGSFPGGPIPDNCPPPPPCPGEPGYTGSPGPGFQGPGYQGPSPGFQGTTGRPFTFTPAPFTQRPTQPYVPPDPITNRPFPQPGQPGGYDGYSATRPPIDRPPFGGFQPPIGPNRPGGGFPPFNPHGNNGQQPFTGQQPPGGFGGYGAPPQPFRAKEQERQEPRGPVLAKSCPVPEVCAGIGCGVVVDERGCQSCSCLRNNPTACTTDSECPENLVCNGGICYCDFDRGFRESKVNPGQCIPNGIFRNRTRDSNSLQEENKIREQNEFENNTIEEEAVTEEVPVLNDDKTKRLVQPRNQLGNSGYGQNNGPQPYQPQTNPRTPDRPVFIQGPGATGSNFGQEPYQTTIRPQTGYGQGSDFGQNNQQGSNFGPNNQQGSNFGQNNQQGSNFGQNNQQGTNFGRNNQPFPNSNQVGSGYGQTNQPGSNFGPNNQQGSNFGQNNQQGSNFGPNNQQGSNFGQNNQQGTNYGPNNQQGSNFGQNNQQGSNFGQNFPNNNQVGSGYGQSNQPGSNFGPNNQQGSNFGGQSNQPFPNNNQVSSGYGQPNYQQGSNFGRNDQSYNNRNNNNPFRSNVRQNPTTTDKPLPFKPLVGLNSRFQPESIGEEISNIFGSSNTNEINLKKQQNQSTSDDEPEWHLDNGEWILACRTNADCTGFKSCCQKEFCDDKDNNCGVGRFCLAECKFKGKS